MIVRRLAVLSLTIAALMLPLIWTAAVAHADGIETGGGYEDGDVTATVSVEGCFGSPGTDAFTCTSQSVSTPPVPVHPNPVEEVPVGEPVPEVCYGLGCTE